jgi:hypothetical protein
MLCSPRFCKRGYGSTSQKSDGCFWPRHLQQDPFAIFATKGARKADPRFGVARGAAEELRTLPHCQIDSGQGRGFQSGSARGRAARRGVRRDRDPLDLRSKQRGRGPRTWCPGGLVAGWRLLRPRRRGPSGPVPVGLDERRWGDSSLPQPFLNLGSVEKKLPAIYFAPRNPVAAGGAAKGRDGRDRGRDAGITGTPPSEPDLRISRIRLSS